MVRFSEMAVLLVVRWSFAEGRRRVVMVVETEGIITTTPTSKNVGGGGVRIGGGGIGWEQVRRVRITGRVIRIYGVVIKNIIRIHRS